MKYTHLTATFVISAAVCPMPATAQPAHHDVIVGRSADGRLTLSPHGYVPEETYHTLDPVEGPLIWGWVDTDPGFDHLADPEPENDLYPLEAGAQIWLEVVVTDPASRMLDLALNPIQDPGDETYLGNHTLHIHNYWHIDSLDPGYDPDQCVWHGTFHLRDDGSTGYADSQPFTFSFTNVELREADGDFDQDFSVDLDDMAAWPVCMAGPEQRPNPDDPAITLCEVDCTNAFDFDGDLDVDLKDFAGFQHVAVP